MLTRLAGLALAIATAIFVFSGGLGLTGSPAAAAGLALVAAGAVAWWAKRSLGPSLEAAAVPRALMIVSGVATVAALAQFARLAVFMIDPTQTACSFIPSSTWETQHSCLTAYHVAAEASSTGANVYDNALYSMPDDDPNQTRKARMLGTFKIDVYEYPPPFLLLPRALQWLTPAFLDLRMLWFGLSGGILLLAMLVAARLLGPADGTRALLLAPLVWAALPTMSTFQKGNVQVIIVAGCILAMALFERRRWAAGGAVLGFAIVGKMYPGLLVVYLLVRRQWRAVAWTAGMAAAYSALALLVFGRAPYEAFVDHLPRLLSGEAFPAFRNPAAKAINVSIPGLVFKAQLFGVPGMTFDVMRMVGSAYMLVAVALTVWAGMKAARGRHEPLVWVAIVILATWRSPFLPLAYGLLPPMWLLTLLAATRAPRSRTLAFALIAWVALCLYIPMNSPVDPRWPAVMTTLQQVVTLVLLVMALKGGSRMDAPEEVSI